MTLNLRSILGAVGLWLVVSAGMMPPGVRAQLSTVDLPNLVQNLYTAYQTYESVKRLQTQINQAREQIKHIDISKINDLSGFVRTQRGLYDSLSQDLNTITFETKRVDDQFSQLFGASAAMTPEDRRRGAESWMKSMQGTRQMAIRAQSNAEVAENNAKTVEGILQASRESDSMLSQMQLVIQGIAQLSSQVTVLTRSIDTGFRNQVMEAQTSEGMQQIRHAEVAEALKGLQQPASSSEEDDTLPNLEDR